MRYVKPGYYDKFVCIAGECPATCCACLLYTSDAADD